MSHDVMAVHRKKLAFATYDEKNTGAREFNR